MTTAIDVIEVRRFDGHGNLKAFAKVKPRPTDGKLTP